MKTFRQIYDWSALFSMEGWVPVPTLTSLLPRLSGPVWHGPPPFPASSCSPRHQTTTTGNVSHPFSVNLLTVCPLPSSCTGMNNPVTEDYSTFTTNFMMQRLGGSLKQPSCIILGTPTGISGLRGRKNNRPGRAKYTKHCFEISIPLMQNSKHWLLTARTWNKQ